MRCIDCSHIQCTDGFCEKYGIYISNGNEEHPECDNEKDWFEVWMEEKNK